MRRRKQYIAETVELTDDLLQGMRNVGLVTDETLAMLHLEKSNQTKVCRLIEHLIAQKNVDAFRLFCEAVAPSYKWLVRDLRADLKVERGEVKPHPDTVHEAAALVHGRFGTSKRFSETDKKEMSELIAVRLQIAEDEWRAEIDKVNELLRDAVRRLDSRDQLAVGLGREMREFVRRHEKQLVSHAHDMTTTREFIRHMLDLGGQRRRRRSKAGNGAEEQREWEGEDEDEEEDGDGTVDDNPLVGVVDNAQRLLRQMTLALNQRASLHHEKEKCLRLLGISDPKASLDDAISRATGLNFVNADMDVEDKTETIRKLRRRIEELERELETVADGVDNFRSQLAERDREISKLRRMVHVD